MSLTFVSDPFVIEQMRGYTNQLLDIGECNLGGLNDVEAIVDIPKDIVINDPCDNRLLNQVDISFNFGKLQHCELFSRKNNACSKE